MKIAVIYPEVMEIARYKTKRKEFPPFGALYIAAALEEHGYIVEIIKLTTDNLIYDFSDYDALAFSISSSATFNMFVECRFKSKIKDKTLIMVGGIHANLFPEQTLIDLKPHVVGIGEGEITIIEILKEIHTKNFNKIEGVCFIKDGKPFRTLPRKLNKNIDGFPLPARHLIPQDDFIMNNRMSNTDLLMTHIMPGRGCPFPCRFCASSQTQVQYRSGKNIRQELVHLIENYKIEGFSVVGNDFILNKGNVQDICDSIQDLNLSWSTLSRVDRVDSDILLRMKNSGCYELDLGVETGSQKILDAMKKKINISQIKESLKLTFETGIKNKIFLIHGFPGENHETTMETINLLEKVGHLIDRISLFRFVPLPGTYVYNNPKEYNLRGTLNSPNWDGDWGKFHIHHNHYHWWGNDNDFKETSDSYEILSKYIESKWPPKYEI